MGRAPSTVQHHWLSPTLEARGETQATHDPITLEACTTIIYTPLENRYFWLSACKPPRQISSSSTIPISPPNHQTNPNPKTHNGQRKHSDSDNHHYPLHHHSHRLLHYLRRTEPAPCLRRIEGIGRGGWLIQHIKVERSSRASLEALDEDGRTKRWKRYA